MGESGWIGEGWVKEVGMLMLRWEEGEGELGLRCPAVLASVLVAGRHWMPNVVGP